MWKSSIGSKCICLIIFFTQKKTVFRCISHNYGQFCRIHKLSEIIIQRSRLDTTAHWAVENRTTNSKLVCLCVYIWFKCFPFQMLTWDVNPRPCALNRKAFDSLDLSTTIPTLTCIHKKCKSYIVPAQLSILSQYYFRHSSEQQYVTQKLRNLEVWLSILLYEVPAHPSKKVNITIICAANHPSSFFLYFIRTVTL